MSDFLERARNAGRESKQIEFKCSFDPTSNGEWCEVIKDIVAIANSGGGIIVFGVNDDGSLSGRPLDAVRSIDLADISNKITKYTGCADPLIEIQEIRRHERLLPVFIIQSAATVLVFGNPGTYDIGGGKQKTAFGRGTVYFRHGAKSETGVTEDIRFAFERQLNRVRNSWLKQVKKVVKAPAGAQFIVEVPSGHSTKLKSSVIRVVDDPAAIPVTLTRDPNKGVGTYLHEEVSDGIFDEINNVVDANRALAKGQGRFLLGQSIYYRIYAERRFINQGFDQLEMLFRTGASEFYAPNLYWATDLDADMIGRQIAAIYLAPKGLKIHWLMRTALLLGGDFCRWLYSKWDRRWHHYSQPPIFYFTFAEMIKNLGTDDQRLLATRLAPTSQVSVPGQVDVSYRELLTDPQKSEVLLSAACINIFKGNAQLRSTARALDYVAHGSTFVGRAKEITEAAKAVIGDEPPGDYKD